MGRAKPKNASKQTHKKSKSFLNQRVSKKFRKRTRKNPDFFHININSHFIYDFNNFPLILSKFPNRKRVIPTKEDIIFLSNKISELELSQDKNKPEYITLSKEIFESIDKFHSFQFQPNDKELFILNEIQNCNDRSKISCRNLAELYANKTGKKISKSQVNNILRNKLNFHYVKTSIKTKKLDTKRSKFLSFCFIRTVIKAMKLGFKILFLDESIILCSNNNFRCWRYQNENIYFGNNDKNKKNLLLLIGEREIIHYKITDDNTNQDTFLSFLKECLIDLKEKVGNKYLIILDNLPSHKTEKILEFYQQNKINIIFNIAYCSYFNCIELAFRSLKRQLYKKLFNNINEVENEVKKYFEDNAINITLLANFRETLGQYKLFYEENQNISFDNFDD